MKEALNLCVDIGNQRVKTAVFRGSELVETAIRPKESVKEIIKYRDSHGVESVIITSTSVTKEDMTDILQAFKQHIWLDYRTFLPIGNAYHTPQTLGTDRLAAAVGAWSEAPGHPLLIIDAGTCVTYDVVSKGGVFEGGQISPGLRMRLQAMHEFTRRLPLVEVPQEIPFIGRNTVEAMQGGGAGGMVHEMNGMISTYRRHFKNLKVFLTGGDANFFANHLKTVIFVSPQLVLKGLNQILLYNLRHELEKME